MGLLGVTEQVQGQFNQLREVTEMQKYRSLDNKMEQLIKTKAGIDGLWMVNPKIKWLCPMRGFFNFFFVKGGFSKCKK